MADDIKLVVGADYSQLTALIRTTGQTKTAVKLLAQDFAKTGSQSQYMRGINRIVSAQKNLKDSSRMSQSEIMKLGAQMRQQAQFADALANATNRASVSQKKSTIAQMAATKASNRLGVVTQQAGYQVSDFVVQVQSGTNPLVAFSQQASQLVGVLPLVADGLGMTAKSAIALSAGLGIAIPLISSAAMVIINMMNASEEAQKQMDIMDKGFDEISSSLSKLNSALKTAAEDGLTTLKERYGEVTAEVLRLQSALIEIEKTATKKSIQSQIQTSFTPEFYGQLSQGFNPTQQAVLNALGDPAALAKEISFLENEISARTSTIESKKKGNIFVGQSEIKELQEYKDDLAALKLDFENAGKLKEELAIDQYIFEGYAKLQEQVKSALAEEQYEKAASAISSIRDLAIQAGIDVSQGAFANLTQLEDMLRQFSSAAKDIINEFDASAFAAGMDNRTNEEIQASVKLTNEMVKSGLKETIQQYADAMFAIQRAQAEIAQGRRGEAEFINSFADRLNDALLSRNRLELEYNKKLKEATKEYEKQKGSLADSIGLLEIAIKYGEDSKQYKVMERSQQEDINKQLDEAEEKRLKALGYSDTQVQTIIGLIQKQRGLNEELDKEEKKRKRILKLTEEAASAYSKSKVVGIKADVFDPRGEAGITAVEAMRAGVQVFDYGKGDDTKPPKGKTPAESMASIIKGMEEEAKLQRQIVGLSDQEADRLQILYNLKEKNKTASGKMTEAELIRSAKRIAAINAETAALEKSLETTQGLAETIGNSFGDAFLSIIEGTESAKDAFRLMAQDIIRQLYQILVVEQMVESIGQSLKGSGGTAGNFIGDLLSGLTSNEGGGYTGSGPRSGGLDGKGGFLAMLHPKETVIDHHKGQSGGQPIQVVYNFQGGVTEADLGRALPILVQRTKREVVDAVQRGGNVARVFR